MLRLLTFACPGELRLGAQVGDYVVDLNRANPRLPNDMYELVAGDATVLEEVRATVEEIASGLERQRERLVRNGKVHPLADVTVLAPLPRPRRNVLCIGLNYLSHIVEGAHDRGGVTKPADYPDFFTKSPSSVVGQDAMVQLEDEITQKLDYEAELAVIIGRRGRNIPRERAYEHVFGYTVANDVTARDLQFRHRQWFKGKSFDNSCPLGPVVIPHSEMGDPHGLDIRMRLNGAVMQKANTREMVWKVPDILFWLSQGTSLEPGDIILTGTPEGIGYRLNPQVFLKAGDLLETEIERIGVLRTKIVEG